ncbi:HNH endonuclease signature motif containing protein [Mycolicibacterium baixiangningiae]|uniref:HNH endonuclease signature motif containing protein n=1 Tax=Mycolicibacterium baixiangningiae TaxID=2761578 RepID=UPI0018D17A26|nr:HNH endonuclease signature motif containing protein [Mycolicibacterium baixiangningiae]
MASSAPSFVPSAPRAARLETLFEEVAELTGQRNAIDGRIVEIVAEIDRDGLGGITGARSIPALVAWLTGSSSTNAKTITAVAQRFDEFPRCITDLREGRLSLDQVGVIAEGAGKGSDAHYAELAKHASVNQLRTAIKLEPRPEPEPGPEPDSDSSVEADAAPDPGPQASITKTTDEQYTYWRIALPHGEAAAFDAALQSHHDGLIAQWKRDHGDSPAADRPPLPTRVDAFTALVEAGWDAEAFRRPHGQRTTVVVHLDLKDRIAALHLGPLLSDADRQYLGCDATCEVWFQRDGQVIGSGRTTRLISRTLRRALEHRDRTCAVPGCGATRGLHAHHIQHWEDGGLTELDNLVLLCPYHHRLHHRGVITITGPATRLTVTDSTGRQLTSGSLARPPNQPPPTVAPYPGPSGERADWWWYTPFQPPPPTTN